MTRPQTRERLLRWVVVPALAFVLTGLAVFQYRWSGQLSEATRTQMQSNLQRSLMGFRQDFTRELGAAALEIRSVVDGSSDIKPAELKEQFHHWQQTSGHPNLVSHIYLWQDSGNQGPLRFDPASDQFERVPWPAEFDLMQARLREITSAFHPQAGNPEGQNRRRGGRRPGFGLPRDSADRRGAPRGRRPGMRGRLADALMPWAIDQSIPALSYPVRGHTPAGEPTSRAEVTWLIIQLNPSVLAKEIFPELAQKYFRGSSGMEYHVAVRGAGKDGEHVLYPSVIYSSDPGFGEDSSLPVDATLNLIGPPFGHGGPPDAGQDFFAAPMRPMPGDRGQSPDDRRLAAVEGEGLAGLQFGLVAGEPADAELGALQIGEDGGRPLQLGLERADRGDPLLMVDMAAVAHIDAEGVRPRLGEAANHRRTVGGRPQGRQDADLAAARHEPAVRGLPGRHLGFVSGAGGGRDRPGKVAGKERVEGRARQPGRGTRRPQPPSPADRKAAGCPLPPGRVVASVTMNLHRSLLTPCQTTNANPSRPPPDVDRGSSRP